MRNMKLPAPSIEAFNQSRSFQVGGYEVFEDFIYDTVTYPAAVVATLDVFTTQSNDETITNLKQPGQIPKPDKFHAYQLFIVPEVEETLDTDASAVTRTRDLSRVLYTARGVLKLTPSTTGRTRTGIPLWAIGQVTGMTTNGVGSGISTATNVRELPMNGVGGYPCELALDSTEEIRGQIKFGNPLAISADLPLKVVLYGWRFKKAG